MQFIIVSGIVLLILLLIGTYLMNLFHYPDGYSCDLNIKDVYATYTHIIVGAGTAGCVLAARLTENPNNLVLLIEAGDYFNYLSKVPLLTTLLQNTKNDFSYKTEPQKYSSFGLNDNQSIWPRGKGIGGSGQMNYMVHGYTDVINALKINVTEFPNALRLRNDVLTKKLSDHLPALSKAFLKSARLLNEAGHEDDYEYLQQHDDKINLRDAEITVNEFGIRWSSYESHLKSALARKNLHVLCKTLVTKIIFKDKSAVGIRIKDERNETATINSKKDIILSAGSINSPQLLLLSGIGDEKLLNELKIKAIHPVSEVGKNLHDHLNMPLYVSLDKPVSITLHKVLTIKSIVNYLLNDKGYLSYSPVLGLGNTKNSSLILFSMGTTDESLFRSIANYKLEVFEALFPLHKNNSQHGIVFLSSCLNPTSRGYVRITGKKVHSPLHIDPQYLSTQYDVDCMTEAYTLAIAIAQNKYFKRLGAKVHLPKLKNCPDSTFEDKDYFECAIRTAALTGHHPGGTCRMGDDQNAVVDRNFRVKGLRNLRVVDASVLPTTLVNFPNSFLVQMAELASSILNST